MSDDEAPADVPPNGPPSPPPGGPYPPNWGSAYPPPPGDQYPPGYGTAYPPPGSPPPPGAGNPPPGYWPGYVYAPQPPKHPHSVTALVLGIVSVAAGVACYLPLLVAPVAWVLGHKAMKEIDASGGRYSGRGEAKAGMILGIVGTAILVIALSFVALLIVLSFTVDNFWGDNYDTYDGVFRVGLGLLSSGG